MHGNIYDFIFIGLWYSWKIEDDIELSLISLTWLTEIKIQYPLIEYVVQLVRLQKKKYYAFKFEDLPAWAFTNSCCSMLFMHPFMFWHIDFSFFSGKTEWNTKCHRFRILLLFKLDLKHLHHRHYFLLFSYAVTTSGISLRKWQMIVLEFQFQVSRIG